MAKRRKLEAPSPEDLSRIEAEVARDVTRGAMSAPIAQVAAEAAGLHDARSGALREAQARDQADADRLRQAEAAGLVMVDLPLDQIRADAIVRDRVVIDAEELEELKMSIMKGGLRLPIEVFETPEDDTFRYGLLSGYRRLMAMQALCDYMHGERFGSIKAVVRDPDAMGGVFAAMVEENEIRASLSQYERGRIAVIAAQQDAFVNTEAAVNALFPQASKAKRSKIRSFALIFEELGDLLVFPDLIRERDGLQVAAALRDGADGVLRDALAQQRPGSPEEEAAILAQALAGITKAPDPKKGGRPRKAAGRALASGMELRIGEDRDGWFIRIQGDRVDRGLVETAMAELERLLDAP